ncbi:MAG: Gfo/Idh/MocA family oxidoreductase, partial [Lachnospiraceae bacterium]|nr:Gfo/Idh/MocA family oxidoreductase [Lachnospiraceae bacterium]
MIRIGMIGTGRIAKRFLLEARSGGSVAVIGVYNPRRESADAFSHANDVTGFYGLSELFASVDAVYIASPHETHFEYAKRALMAGKHVLCEKPLCLKEEETKSLFSLAREKNLVLMEGVKTSYSPGFQKVLELIDAGTIGDVAYVDACFTKLESKTSRELTDEVYGGSFRELGSYVMLPALKIFGCDISSHEFDCVYNDKNIDIFTKGTLRFKNGCVANMICGLGVKGDGRLMVSGTKGY